jgi:dihydropteroate synthase
MQKEPRYDDVEAEVTGYLLDRAQALERAGVARDLIAIDPGFGFGKTLAHNKALFHALPRIAGLGYPLVVGVSRKKMIGDLTGRRIEERAAGSVAAALLAAQNGASMVRVHDVKDTVDALHTWMELSR